MKQLEKIKQGVRWKGLSHGKIPLFCTILFYLILKNHMYSSQAITDFFLFLGYSILSGIYGYLINDLFDIDIDRKHGKKNVFSNIGTLKGSFVVLVILMLSIAVGLRFISKTYFLFVWVIWIFCSTFYSARPLRFKERGSSGLIINFVSQYTLPIVLCFSAFDSFGTFDMWGFVLFSTVSGATQELGHQRFDMTRDKKTDTRTFAVRKGQEKVDRLYKFFLVFDLISVLGMMLLMAWNTTHISLFINKGNAFIPPIILYGMLSFFTLIRMFRNSSDVEDPYYEEGRQDILNITYILFPNVFLPLYLSCILFMQFSMFLIFVVLFIVLIYVSYPGANILGPIRVIFSETRNLFRK